MNSVTSIYFNFIQIVWHSAGHGPLSHSCRWDQPGISPQIASCLSWFGSGVADWIPAFLCAEWDNCAAAGLRATEKPKDTRRSGPTHNTAVRWCSTEAAELDRIRLTSAAMTGLSDPHGSGYRTGYQVLLWPALEDIAIGVLLKGLVAGSCIFIIVTQLLHNFDRNRKIPRVRITHVVTT